MKKIIPIFLLFLMVSNAYSQIVFNKNAVGKTETITKGGGFGNYENLVASVAKPLEHIDITVKGYSKLLTRDLSQIVVGSNALDGMSSYATINPTQPQATVSAAAMFSIGSFKLPLCAVNASFKGGATDNIVEIWKGGKVSSEFEGKMDISFFKPVYYYVPDEWDKLEHSLTTKYYKLQNDRFNYLVELEKKQADPVTKYNVSGSFDANCPASGDCSKLPGSSAEAHRYYADLKVDYDSKFNERVNDSLVEHFANTAVYSTKKILWFSLFGSVSGQKFFLYNFKRNIYNQIYDSTFIGGEAGISLNAFYHSDYGAYRLLNGYYRLAFSYIRDNNKDQERLNTIKTSYTETHKINDTSTLVTTYSKEQKSYADTTYFEFHGFKLAFDVYKEITRNVSLHAAFTSTFTKKLNIENSERVIIDASKVENIDVSAGIVFGIKKKDDPKTILNIEPLITFQNLTDKYHEKKSIRNRIKLELKLAVPFNYFVFNTKS